MNIDNILVIEPHAFGHRAVYVKYIVEGVISEGKRVVLATSREAITNPIIKSLMSSYSDRINIVLMNFSDRGIKLFPAKIHYAIKEFKYYSAFKKAYLVANNKFDIIGVILPYLDYCFHAICILGSPFSNTSWSSIFMRVNKGRGDRQIGRVRLYLLGRILDQPSLKSLFNISYTYSHSDFSLPVRSKKLNYLPDPAKLDITVDIGTARSTLGIKQDEFVVLVYGEIVKRKGVEFLIRATRTGNNFKNKIKILIIGQQDKEMKEYFSNNDFIRMQQEGTIVLQDSFVTDRMQSIVLAACDVVWLGYVGHYVMSGVMVLAGISKKPIIACEEGEIGYCAKNFEIGPVVDPKNIKQVIDALEKLMDQEIRYHYAKNSFYLFEKHTPGIFAKIILESLISK